MFWRIAWFEIKFWLRSWMLWIFFVVIALLVFTAVSTPNLTLFFVLTNTHRNAPFVIQGYYAYMSLFMLIMMAAFINSSALRDFRFNTNQIVFSTPIRRRDFLLGRFVGGSVLSAIPMLGVSAGILLAKYMPWADPDRWGPVDLSAHLHGITVLVLPTVFFMAAILFAAAVLARNEIVPFVVAIVLLIGYIAGDSIVSDIKYERIAALLDPFAARTLGLVTKYWTVAEKNSLSIHYSGLMLWNRLLWIGVGLAIFAFAYFRFSFAEKRTKTRGRDEGPESRQAPVAQPLPVAAFHSAPWLKLLGSLKIHVRGMVTSIPFMILVFAGAVNCIVALIFNATEGYGNHSLPVTYWVLSLIRGTLYIFLVPLLTYYAGNMVWKDREERMDEIVDTTPTPEWVSYASRLATLVIMVLLIQLGALVSGVIVQAAYGYHRFQLGFYARELFVRDGSLFLFLSILAFFMHAVAPNKYIGYCGYIAFVVANFFIWGPLNVATLLVQFANRPRMIYSEFFGEAPFVFSWDWFTAYWVTLCLLLAIASIVFWPRGKQDRWRGRGRVARLRFQGGWAAMAVLSGMAFAATGGWIYYNTKVLNPLRGSKDNERLQADYEKTYKPLDKVPQPRPLSLKYTIDVFPEARNVVMHGDEVIYNPYPQPLREIHFSVDRNYDVAIEVPGASLSKDDKRLAYRIYHFDSPLAPGEQRTMHFTVKTNTRGFENEVSNLSVVQNGTFFNSTIAPRIGYDASRELADAATRKRYGLTELDLMPALERDC